MKNKFTQEEVAQYFKDNGYELLSEYKGHRELVRVRNAKGEEYEVWLYNFKRGKRPERRVKKIPTERVISHLSSEGYEMLSSYTCVDAKMKIMCAMGHVFEVSYTNFKLGRRCSECSSVSAGGMSIGERLVWSVLQANQNILKNVAREVTVYIEDSRHRFDFLFKMGDKQFAIEYDGKQHYGGRSMYENPSKKDVVKNNYCKSNNIELIRIPYTVQTLPDTTRYIENRLGIPLALTNKIYSKSIQDVAEYYLTHSREETAGKFGISLPRVSEIFKELYGSTKQSYPYKPHRVTHTYPRITNTQEGVAEYYLTHSLSATVSTCSVGKGTVDRYFKRVYGMGKSEYLKQCLELAEA